MTEEEYRWVLRVALEWNALLFLWVGRFGWQWVLMPRVQRVAKT